MSLHAGYETSRRNFFWSFMERHMDGSRLLRSVRNAMTRYSEPNQRLDVIGAVGTFTFNVYRNYFRREPLLDEPQEQPPQAEVGGGTFGLRQLFEEHQRVLAQVVWAINQLPQNPPNENNQEPSEEVEPTAEPAVEPAMEPAVEPAVEHAVEPAVEPAADD